MTDPVHDLEVTEITLNKMLTGGMNRDHRNGDEGILVIVEPRNPKNQIVQSLGEISVVVLDPALEGEAARVARWDITPQELEHSFRTRQLGRGLQLALPWPGDPPQHSDLHLFVRFVADDGRKLIADRELKIEPPGGGAEGGWVPSTRSDVAVRDQEVPAIVEVPSAPDADTATAAPRTPPQIDPAGSEVRATSATPSPSSNNAAATKRSEPRVARATQDEPRPAGPKRRPQWSPYR